MVFLFYSALEFYWVKINRISLIKVGIEIESPFFDLIRKGEFMLKQCMVCGNDYDKSIEIKHKGETKFFDCFECAIHALAPKCDSCGLSIIGHGAEVGMSIFCSAHCARKRGNVGLTDRLSPQIN